MVKKEPTHIDQVSWLSLREAEKLLMFLYALLCLMSIEYDGINSTGIIAYLSSLALLCSCDSIKTALPVPSVTQRHIQKKEKKMESFRIRAQESDFRYTGYDVINAIFNYFFTSEEAFYLARIML